MIRNARAAFWIHLFMTTWLSLPASAAPSRSRMAHLHQSGELCSGFCASVCEPLRERSRAMKNIILAILAGGALISLIPNASADDAQFLTSLQGRYEGSGKVRLRTNLGPINVICSFRSSATTRSLSLDGKCRGLLVVSRTVGAKLIRNGSAYKGSYVGAGSGPAKLSGKRIGNSLKLIINWATEINGDRRAQLSVAKAGARGLTLTTTDKDPLSGKSVVTSMIVLQRI